MRGKQRYDQCKTLDLYYMLLFADCLYHQWYGDHTKNWMKVLEKGLMILQFPD
jgi:hypothetical protein